MMQRKKMKKFLGLTVALTVMSSVLTGCGSSTGQEEPATPAQDADDTAGSENNGNDAAATADGEKAELRFLLWGNQKEIEYREKWTDQFNASNDRIHVTLEAIPEGFHDKLTLEISSDTLADMVMIAGDFGGEYFKEGLFTPLDSYIEADGLQDVWVDGVMDGLSYNGSVYAAPTSFNAAFIFYNKTMFEENNVPLPTNDWTEEEFVAAAKALTKGEGEDKVWGIDLSSWWSYELARNLYDGYKAWDWESGTMTADTQGYRDGLEFLTNLYQVDQVSPTPTMAADIGGTFETGKFAMTVGAAWDMESFNSAIGDSFEWDIVTFPSNPTYGQWRSPLWPTAIGISEKTPYKDEAWEYIKYMAASEEVQGEMENIGLPTMKSICEDESFMTSIPDGWKPFNKQVYFDALDYSVDGVVLNEIKDEIIKVECELLFAGEQDLDTTLENIQTKGQLKLDRMKEE